MVCELLPMVCELLRMDTHQCLKVFVVLCITLSGVAVAGDLNIEFLEGVSRFNSNTGYKDFYVCCNVQGSFLSWQVGTNRLAGFRAMEVGKVRVDARSTYEYTAILLSSRPLSASNQHQMDSVIVVTFIGMTPSEFQVTCISDTNTSTITVVGNTSAVRRTKSSDHDALVLDYVLTSSIVQNNEFTHIFMCGAKDGQQYYEYDVEGNRIGFNAQNNVGQKRQVLSADGFTVTILCILIGQQPYNLTSILFISENSGVNVTCFDRNNRIYLLSDSSPITTPMPSVAPRPGNILLSSPSEPPVSSPSSILNTPPRPDMTSTPSITTDDNVNVPDDNVTVPDGNVTVPDDNVTVPDGNVTVPDDNVNVNVIIIPVVVVIGVGVILAFVLLLSCICYYKCYRSGKCPPKNDDSSKEEGDDDSSKKKNKNNPSYSRPAETETSFGTDCSKSGGSSSPSNSPKNEDLSKKNDSEESDSEGYSSGVWSASDDGFSDDELLRKLMERASDRLEQWRDYLHHFVWIHNRSYTYDNLVFIKDSRSPYSKKAGTSIVVDGHTKGIQNAVNDVVFVKPSKIPRVCSRQVLSFSIAEWLKQEIQDSSSSTKAVYISHCTSETNSSKVAVSTGSSDVVVCKESPDVAAVVIAAGNPFKMVRVLSRNDNVCVMKEGYVLQNEESLTTEKSQCQSEKGFKVIISKEKLLLQRVKNLERRISMVVQGAGDLTGGSGAHLLSGTFEGSTSAIIARCWYNKRAVLIDVKVGCQRFIIVLTDKEAGFQGESPRDLINTPKMVTVQQVITKKLVANDFDYWMQVIHHHVLQKRKTHSSPVCALVSQDASLKTHSLSGRIRQHPYLRPSKGPQLDNRQGILSNLPNLPNLRYQLQLQRYFHEGHFYKDSFQKALVMIPDNRGMVLIHEPPDAESPPSHLFSPSKKTSFRKQQSLDSTPTLSLMSLSSMSSNSSSTCSQSNSSVEGGKAGSAGTIEDKLETRKVYTLVQWRSLIVGTPGSGKKNLVNMMLSKYGTV